MEYPCQNTVSKAMLHFQESELITLAPFVKNIYSHNKTMYKSFICALPVMQFI